MRGPSPHRQRGVTLIELMLAITIFMLVVGTIYASLFTGVQAVKSGRESMEIYQNTRAGMNRLLKDLRKSLSPAAFPFKEREQEELFEEEFYYADDDDEIKIIFRGDSNQVEFAIRQEVKEEDGPSMDIRQVRYKSGDEDTVVKEIYRSILQARLEELRHRRIEEKFGPEAFFSPSAEGGLFEDPVVQIVCEGVRELEFSYYDGNEWKSSWDSEEIVINEFSMDLDLDLLTEEDEEKVGLPQLVRVDFTLVNGVQFQATTDVPSSELNFLGPRGNESDFAGAFRSRLGRIQRLEERARSRGYYGSRGGSRRSRFF